MFEPGTNQRPVFVISIFIFDFRFCLDTPLGLVLTKNVLWIESIQIDFFMNRLAVDSISWKNTALGFIGKLRIVLEIL